MSLYMAERSFATVVWWSERYQLPGVQRAESATVSHQVESRSPFSPTAVSMPVLECRLRALSSTPIVRSVATEQPIAHIMNWDCAPHYAACPKFGHTYIRIREEAGTWDWPEGIQLLGGELYRRGLLCVPTDLTPYVIRMAHEACRHLRGPRLRQYVKSRFEWGHYFKAHLEICKARRGCVTCEKFKADHLRREPLRGAFFPRSVGVSVAVDLLKVPSTKSKGQTYHAVVLSTDRHSGWMVDYHTRLKGLTGQQVAQRTFHSGGWDVMAIPSEVTSDRGPQFISQCWSTICGQMGVRHAMAEA